jgi:putative transposase
VNTVWNKTIVQTCIVHLLRNSFRYASRRDWAAIAKDLKPVYTAHPSKAPSTPSPSSAFLAFDLEIRKIICTTNAIESINSRLRRAVNARGHFPTEQAALKCLYLALMGLDPTGKGSRTLDHALESRLERLRWTPVHRTQLTN